MQWWEEKTDGHGALPEWIKETRTTAENKNIWFYSLKCKRGTCLNIQFTWFAFYMLLGEPAVLEKWS